MLSNPADFYSHQLATLDAQLEHIKKQQLLLFIVRAITFVLLVVFALLCFRHFTIAGLLLLLLGLVAFVLAVRADQLVAGRKKLIVCKRNICSNELQYLAHSFSFAHQGDEFSGLEPSLSADFDLFGQGSVFQYINRSATRIGEERFARSLCQFALDGHLIVPRQQAIAELSAKIDMLHHFRAKAMLVEGEDGNEVKSLQTWLKINEMGIVKLRFICGIIPLLSVVWISLALYGAISVGTMLLLLCINYSVVVLGGKHINKAHQSLGRTAKIFSKYASLIQIIEEEKFDSDFLMQIQNKCHGRNVGASRSLSQLFGLLRRFDLRYNMLLSFLLNSLLGFDFQIYRKLVSWKRRCGDEVLQWIDALSNFDSIIGFATYAFNNSQYVVFPTPLNSKVVIDASELGHPLIPAKDRVCNSIRIAGQPSVLIITGANMAGKSTFLRTLAVNMVLAMNGAPVCARNFEFTPCGIMSSIKIQDSLVNNESYFYSELLRLKAILVQIEENPRTMVILDEILRGTNTKDKQVGSLGLLEKLIERGANVVIATHDLAIGELANKYPEIVHNYCFEVELTNNQLVFDYKLKSGISKKPNASFLMKEMGIINA